MSVDEDLRVTRPFAVFVAPPDGEDCAQWVAHVVGHSLDNVTEGPSPEGALLMAVDMLCALTGRSLDDVRAELDALGGSGV